MTNTDGSRRISSAMASRRASRTVIVTISVPSGTSGSGTACGWGGDGAAACFGSAGGRAAAVRDGGRVLPFRQDHCDRGIDRDVGGAFGNQDLAERALVGRFHLHG